nr:hypothetical protein B0A51_14105 [Rachicladosporium sp. CCFEE 5018]
MASFEEADGSLVQLCPRSRLAETIDNLATHHDITSLVGFEVEITFCRGSSPHAEAAVKPLDSNHAWSTMTDEQLADSMPSMVMICEALADAGIYIQQFHSEAGQGQYEFVLPPSPPEEAIDTLYQARQIIQHMASRQGLRATCHPSPFPPVGTACHANISLSSGSAPAHEEKQMSFFAGVLSHLPALCAFTLPEEVSYIRVADDHWTSGTWVAWGTQNREVPIRRVAGTDGTTERWEVRCLDGMPNMYLAMFAVFAAGLQGLNDGTEMKLKDCQSNPSQLSEVDKTDLGIETKLPTSLSQSLEALNEDTALNAVLGTEVVDHYIGMKKAEQAMLNETDDKIRRIWLMERY